MTKDEQIKQLMEERDHAREIAVGLEQQLAGYELGLPRQEGPDIEAFMRVANGILNERPRQS